MLNTSAFVKGLIAAETPPKSSTAEAAQGFVDAFTEYLLNAMSNGITITTPSLYLPSAQNALKGGLISAFSLDSGPSVADTIGNAILAFFNAGPASAFFSSAIGAGIFNPLSAYMSAISSPVDTQNAAKSAVASAITSWLNAGPGGFAIIFPGSPSDIKAPIT